MPAAVRRFLVLAALIALAGCGTNSDEAVDVAVIGESAAAIADPAAGPLDAPEQVMLMAVAQGLVRFDARGQIQPGLAERWNVTDDGLSYIFRLAAGTWPDGREIAARDIARLLTRQVRSASRNELKDTLGAIDEIVAMTDRVIEVRLTAPRPNLLQLLAQPELGVVRDGDGTGPFQIVEPADGEAAPAGVSLTRRIVVVGGPDRFEQVRVLAAPAAEAVKAFKDDRVQLVLGGTFADLPIARQAELPGSALRFDPVAGLFGLVPARRGGPLAERELRQLLSQAIDRDSLVAALDVPGLVPRATVLQAGLDGIGTPGAPEWSGIPAAERHDRLAAEAERLYGDLERPAIAIRLPDGPGSAILLDRLNADWAPLGIKAVRADDGVPADLILIDRVAPSTSPAWFVRTFRCDHVPLCSEEADELMESARSALVAPQRAALLTSAAAIIDGEFLFIPIAAPIRWSLVDDDIEGFAENLVARHPLTGLRERLSRERQ